MKARFFCANCGTEVSARAERCPTCGKFFRAVTCPKCGFEGDVDAFLRGCPVCHYMVDVAKLRSARAGRSGGTTRRTQRTFSPAFYKIAAVVLLLALAALVTILIVISK